MMEITLCRHNEIKSRCRACFTEADTELKRLQAQRACADCETYHDLGAMTQMHDGRVICATCRQKIGRQTAKRAQADLFTQQTTLF